jgi:hypothetical protein
MIKLEEQSVVVHLSDEGRRVLRQVGVELPDTPAVRFDVQEESDHGLWISLDYPDGRRHVLLIRWEYILAMDVIVGEVRTEGLVN